MSTTRIISRIKLWDITALFGVFLEKNKCQKAELWHHRLVRRLFGEIHQNQAVIPSRFIYFMKIKNCDISMGQSAWQHSIGLVFKATWHYVARIPWKLLIPSRFISWKNSFSNISRKCILPNMIWEVNYSLWL